MLVPSARPGRWDGKLLSEWTRRMDREKMSLRMRHMVIVWRVVVDQERSGKKTASNDGFAPASDILCLGWKTGYGMVRFRYDTLGL